MTREKKPDIFEDDEDDDENSIKFFQTKSPQIRERSRDKENEKDKNNLYQSKTYQKPFKRDLCKYYLNGICTKGDNCSYSHITKDFPCKYYIIFGKCNQKECK